MYSPGGESGHSAPVLAAKAYSAAGQADSALHAIAILQVHQAKALKQMHVGSTDPVPSLAQPDRDEGRRQDMLSRRPH